jgi:hypothetical protein
MMTFPTEKLKIRAIERSSAQYAGAAPIRKIERYRRYLGTIGAPRKESERVEPS